MNITSEGMRQNNNGIISLKINQSVVQFESFGERVTRTNRFNDLLRTNGGLMFNYLPLLENANKNKKTKKQKKERKKERKKTKRNNSKEKNSRNKNNSNNNNNKKTKARTKKENKKQQ